MNVGAVTAGANAGVLAVHAWPGPVPTTQDGLFVIGVATSPRRDTARAQIRLALAEAVAAVLALPAASIDIDSAPGRAPAVVVRRQGMDQTIHCSIAHEEQLALAAVNLRGPVGIDVMRVRELDDWRAVAADYLGPEALQAIAAASPAVRARAFAQAWTAHEARLKCQGLALSEWRAGGRWTGHMHELALPPMFCAALAAGGGETI